MAKSLAVALYLAASHLATGPARRIVQRRLAAGKEDPERSGERFGDTAQARPDGRLIWFHAASVGEALSLLELIKLLLDRFPDLSILVTTVTRTSAEVLAQRLPPRAIHQFSPVDTTQAVRRFLAHWHPDLAVWTESELWPTLICRTKAARIPMLLINARVSEDSARRHRWLGGFAASLLNRFDGILAQDDATANRIYRLGADSERIRVAGSLKDAARPLPHDAEELKVLSKTLHGRMVWLAASTHEGEEEAVADAHTRARRGAHSLALILAPRHPERGSAIAEMMRARGWTVAQRSRGEALTKGTDVYVVDTIGEMGLWYRLAAVSFVGGSLVPVGGHNPYEPAQLGSAILHGPHVKNFESAYQKLSDAGGALLVPTPESLGEQLAEALRADRSAALANAAWRVVSESSEVADRVMTVLIAHLPKNADLAAMPDPLPETQEAPPLPDAPGSEAATGPGE